MKYLFGLFFLVIMLPLHSQVYEGVVFDSETKESLPYINIGLVGKDIGTVSDVNGKFSVNVPQENLKDTLRFSMIGYQAYDILPNELDSKEKLSIYLKPKDYELDEIVVLPKEYVPTWFGNFAKGKGVSAGFDENKLGYELGVLMKLKKRQGFLEKMVVNVASCKYDSVFFRVNVYEMDGKEPGENILTKPIYVSYAKEDLKESIEIDLGAEDIFVKGDFVVTLELVKDLGTGGLNFCTGFFKNPLFYKETSQGNWQKSKMIAIGISAVVRVEED